MLAHDDDLVPVAAFVVTPNLLDAACRINECVAVTPHEVDFAKLGQQVQPVSFGLEGTIDQVGGLVVEAIGHVEIGLGNRVALIEVDGSLAAESILHRGKSADFRGLSADILLRTQCVERVLVQPPDARVLFDHDDRFVIARGRSQRFSGRQGRILEIGCGHAGAGPLFIVRIAAAAQEPQEHDTGEDQGTRNNQDPRICGYADYLVEQRRFGTGRRRNHVARRSNRCVGFLLRRVRHFGIFGFSEKFVFGRKFVLGHFGLITLGLEALRLVEVAANLGQFLAQRCQFVVANLDQRLLLRHIRAFELGDTIENLLLAKRYLGLFSRRLCVFGYFRPGTQSDGFLVGRHELQARSRRRHRLLDGRRGSRCAAPPGMVALRFVQRVGAIDTINVVSAGKSKPRAGTQDIDVAAERFRIRLVDRKHRLVHRQAEVGPDARCDSPQRLARLHDVVLARRRVVRQVGLTGLRLGLGHRFRFRFRLAARRGCRYRARRCHRHLCCRHRPRLRRAFDPATVRRRPALRCGDRRP